MAQPTCPECTCEIPLPPDSVKSEILQCSDCGVELEVTDLNPATLALAPQEEEDWGE